MKAREIQDLLREKGLTQETLAKRWGIRPPTLSNVIYGRIASANLERKLAKVLGVAVKALREGRERT